MVAGNLHVTYGNPSQQKQTEIKNHQVTGALCHKIPLQALVLNSKICITHGCTRAILVTDSYKALAENFLNLTVDLNGQIFVVKV
jgi:hypothetical protein